MTAMKAHNRTDKLDLRHQIRLACFIDQFRKFRAWCDEPAGSSTAHRSPGRTGFRPLHADHQSPRQKSMPAHAEKMHGRQIRQHPGWLRPHPCVPVVCVSECGQQAGPAAPLRSRYLRFRNAPAPCLMARPVCRMAALPAPAPIALTREQKGHEERKCCSRPR